MAEESAEEAKRNAPYIIHSRDRAVTVEDFEALTPPGFSTRPQGALPCI